MQAGGNKTDASNTNVIDKQVNNKPKNINV